MMREKSSYSFLRSLVKGQDDSFFKDLTGVVCIVGGTLVDITTFTCYQRESYIFDQNLYTLYVTSIQSSKFLMCIFQS
jgi:hypothetical protein